jgi:Ca2+:H+ antiporter
VPLVEKCAEHVTTIGAAWNSQMNSALIHILGSAIQTALLNAPLVVIVGWGLGVRMDLNFEIFDAIVLTTAILVVATFLRGAKTNYLDGVLCVLVYVIIAIAAFYYPNAHDSGTASDSWTLNEQAKRECSAKDGLLEILVLCNRKIAGDVVWVYRRERI